MLRLDFFFFCSKALPPRNDFLLKPEIELKLNSVVSATGYSHSCNKFIC